MKVVVFCGGLLVGLAGVAYFAWPPLTNQSAAAGEAQRREESKRRHTEAYERALKTHAAQPVDSGWAGTASEMFRADIEAKKAESRAKVVGVDCRTDSCVAELAWPSFHEARTGFRAVLHAHYRVNCVKSITLPEPKDPSKPFIGHALFVACEKTPDTTDSDQDRARFA